MPLSAKDSSVLTTLAGAGTRADMAGPLMTAAMLPVTLMMAGWMAVLGTGLGVARAFSGRSGDDDSGEPPVKVPDLRPSQSGVPRLVVSNPPPASRVPAQAAVKAKVAPKAARPVPAKPSGAPPKPSRPGGVPPKPKAAVAEVTTVAAQTAPMPSVEAAKPTPAKPSGAPPKPSKPGGIPPKPKAAKPEVPPVNAGPATVKPLKIEAKPSAKGISLAKVSMQDKPGEPDKQ